MERHAAVRSVWFWTANLLPWADPSTLDRRPHYSMSKTLFAITV